MAAWPSGLIQAPLVGSLRSEPEVNVAESQNGVGPAKRRRRSALAHTVHSYEIAPFSSAQVDTLLAFFRDDTDDGATPHTQEHPRTHATITAQFVEPPKIRELTIGCYSISINIRQLSD